jgi:hypothetical protein
MTSTQSVSRINAWGGSPMRAAVLLGLLLAGCAGGKLPGEQPAPRVAEPTASAPPAAAASQAAAAPVATASNAAAPSGRSDSERVIEARADCWMKVERERGLRDIDRRIAFVDKCVAEQLRAGP